MKSIYITGGNGLLATNLVQYLKLYKIKLSLRKYENLIPKADYDLVDSRNYSLVKRKILDFKPHVIIHTAGMTDIEKSEKFRRPSIDLLEKSNSKLSPNEMNKNRPMENLWREF